MTQRGAEIEAFEILLSQEKNRGIILATLLVCAGVYMAFDKFVLDPRVIASVRAELTDEFEQEKSQLVLESQLTITRLEAGILETENKTSSELKQVVTNLQQRLFTVETDLSAASARADRAETGEKRVQVELRGVEEKLRLAEGDLQKLRLELDSKLGSIAAVNREFAALKSQQSILLDGLVEQILRVNREAPKSVPEEMKEKMTGVVRRIRDIQKALTSGISAVVSETKEGEKAVERAGEKKEGE